MTSEAKITDDTNYMSGRIVDLFSGPGGWSEGLRMLGCSEVGIEWDEAACATARAAGHDRVQADVAAVDPMDFAPCSGLIGSPPCQAYSAAGKGAGRQVVAHVLACAADMASGGDTRTQHAQAAYGVIEPLAHLGVLPEARNGRKRQQRRRWDRRRVRRAQLRDSRREDVTRSMLVVEPLRWALALRPAWIALEQVPPVLPLWEVFANALRAVGYSVWTGVLEAERYGVPQTRERAILMARHDRPVQPPPPTHQRYVPGEPQRYEVTMLGEVLPWVSMAEALGWGMTERPSVGVASGGEKRRGAKPLGVGSGSQRTIDAERDAGAWAYKLARGEGITERHGDRPAQPATEPALTISTKARTAEWVMRANKQANSAVRETSEPAPTITGGHDTGNRAWINGMDRRQGGAPVRAIDEPAHTMSSQGLSKGRDVWVHERPAPTVVGTRRSKDGMLIGRQLPEGEGENIGGWSYAHQPARPPRPEKPGSQQKSAVRVTVQEAAILQSFRPDYPWHGSKSKQYQQVGNAIPPLLARAILSELVDPAGQQKAP